jgi:hypothetical protein
MEGITWVWEGADWPAIGRSNFPSVGPCPNGTGKWCNRTKRCRAPAIGGRGESLPRKRLTDAPPRAPWGASPATGSALLPQQLANKLGLRLRVLFLRQQAFCLQSG